jgi:hypothetical protein
MMTIQDPLPTLDESFPRTYEATAVGWVSTDTETLYLPYRPYLLVEIVPHDIVPGEREAWKAVFPGHDLAGGGAVTGLFTTPVPDMLCVVCRGVGYAVDLEETPLTHHGLEIWSTPVRSVLPFPRHRLIVFGDFIHLVGYRLVDQPGDYGLREAWRSARLGYDDLEILRTTEDRIEGRAWNAPRDEMMGFSLDVRTGEHEGGAYDIESDSG